MNHSDREPKDSGEFRLPPLPDFEFGEPVQLKPETTGEFRLPPLPGLSFEAPGEQPIEPEAPDGEFRLPPLEHTPYTGPMHLRPLNTGESYLPLEAEEANSNDEDADDDPPPMKGSVLGLD